MKAILKQPLTPEHDKQSVAVERAITEFLEFIDSKGIMFCKADEETDNYYPISKNHRALIFEFFGIDMEKWEQENRALLEYLRSLNEREE